MELEPNNPVDAPKSKVRLLSLADLDGRTLAARTTKRLIGELESDLGGGDRLTAGERVLAHRAAAATAMAEDLEARWLTGQPVDIGMYATLVNAAARLLRTLGLQRRPRDVTPSLQDYVAFRAAPGPTLPPPPATPVAPLFPRHQVVRAP
jgi:hypothetical protein